MRKKTAAIKRIRRFGRYYIVVRDSSGRFTSFKPYKLPRASIEKRRKTAIEKIKPEEREEFLINKIRKQKYRSSQAYAKKIKKKQAPVVHITKRNLIEKTVLTNVIEVELKKPLKGEKGLLQITFIFSKKRRTESATGRSDKLFFPKQFITGFNQCIRRAFAQIDFSPDEIRIRRLSYIYWLKK